MNGIVKSSDREYNSASSESTDSAEGSDADYGKEEEVAGGQVLAEALARAERDAGRIKERQRNPAPRPASSRPLPISIRLENVAESSFRAALQAGLHDDRSTGTSASRYTYESAIGIRGDGVGLVSDYDFASASGADAALSDLGIVLGMAIDCRHVAELDDDEDSKIRRVAMEGAAANAS